MMVNHSKMKYRIVLVPFPFDDFSSSKVRPAICLTDPIGLHRHVVIAFITSQKTKDYLSTDLAISSTAKDFETTGLRVSSTIRLHRMITVAPSFIHRNLGTLPLDFQNEVDKKCKMNFYSQIDTLTNNDAF